MSQPIRLGIAGGSRGRSYDAVGQMLRGRTKVTAICDTNPKALDDWRKDRSDVALFADFQKMLDADACDAVAIATPMQVHAKQASAALRAGKHVLSEVPACLTDAEARQLVAAQKDSKAIYMMAENYCYMRPHMMVRNMVEKGAFGELTYAEGMYVHAIHELFFKPDGKPTWRGDVHGTGLPGNTYPTHSMGPLAQWLGIGVDDALASVCSISTKPVGLPEYAKRAFGESNPAAKRSWWNRGDSNSCLVKTKLGRTIYLRMDLGSHRPHHMTIHELQGLNACYRTPVDPHDDPLIWIEGRSKGQILPAKDGSIDAHNRHAQWDSLFKYADEFEHPRWKAQREQAEKTGHGGGDFFILEDFVNAIENRTRPAIDVYDAVAWSSIVWLSAESERTGQAVQAIDYQRAG